MVQMKSHREVFDKCHALASELNLGFIFTFLCRYQTSQPKNEIEKPDTLAKPVTMETHRSLG